jgi:hypothetical protein
LVHDFGLFIYLCINSSRELDLGSNYPTEFAPKGINKLGAIVWDNTLGGSIISIDINKKQLSYL